MAAPVHPEATISSHRPPMNEQKIEEQGSFSIFSSKCAVRQQPPRRKFTGEESFDSKKLSALADGGHLL